MKLTFLGGETVVMKIKAYREKMGMTQRKLGETIGVDCSTVAKWESEIALPNAMKLPLLAQTLGCTIDELYGRGKDGA